ncbi:MULTISPECIES: EF-hand domain-containing protein [Rhizobium]|uniref:EF-hand domain-containing protein n=1 Tax=Rhizobium TaxID=379 RepID=UPI001B319EA1|nr:MULTISPECIES: EF-hand domain-containing protein [Rhizobium]MBX4909128.1 calcium-binding protein [Rhizobium bangladeshense]MBX5214770.1 calcium-binding protein [Rhizobium sp. NLR9a]MBX5220482.1 calcium-binding protein [Rhizobium sp. NLR8a]MBX5225950.1 calcium-binding protein [Rhizobium sp. NLR9b]MBX5244185.1 calcium-binding protein [Rhizobium sp. NLR3b]
MYRNKPILAALSSVLIFGVAAGASFAAPGDGPRPHHAGMDRPGRDAFLEITYVRMLKEFDANKDGKVSKEEASSGLDKIFAAIDTNNDGSLTPGEIRQYRQTQLQAMRDQHKQDAGDEKDANAAPDMPDSESGRPPRDGHDGHRWMRHGGNIMHASMMMHRIDTDENGQISKQEAVAAFDKLFTRMDRDKDGVISIDDMPDRPLL